MATIKSAFTALTLALSFKTAASVPLRRSQKLLDKFSSLVIFGDSYTDDGVHSYTPPVEAQVRHLNLIMSSKVSIRGRLSSRHDLCLEPWNISFDQCKH